MTDLMGQTKEQQEVAFTIPEQQGLNPDVSSTEKLPYPSLAPCVFRCLKQTSIPRKWCLFLTCGPWLDLFSTFMVVVSCVALGMNKPCAPKRQSLEILELILFAYFMVEMIIKMVALGLYGYEGSYFRCNWNRFDCFINFGELLDNILSFVGLHLYFIRACRAMMVFILAIRSLQWLRESLNVFPGTPYSLRVLVGILLETMPMLGNVLVLYIFVIHIFAVVGIQLWAGELRNRCFLGEDINAKYNVTLSPYYISKDEEKSPFICSRPNKNGMLHCKDLPPYRGNICSSAAPQHGPAVSQLFPTVDGANKTCTNWHTFYNVCRAGDDNPHMGAINFDNIVFAWITIFQVVTLEGWTEIMFFVMDAHSSWSFIFFILATIMGSFIMMNVCAVVIATQFSENMEREPPKTSASSASITWLCSKITVRLKRITHRQKSTVHPETDIKIDLLGDAWTRFNRKLKRMVRSQLFDKVIMFAVFLSILAMVIEHHKQPIELTRVLDVCNIILTIAFLVEMIIKLMALTWKYFIDANNIFDGSIVVISVWELVAETNGRLSVLRAFRLLRFVRLVHFLPYLKRQLLVLKRTMKEAAALCKLLLFVIFLFSILGRLLFCDKFKFTTKNGEIVRDRENFDTLLWSMVTVFQLLTQEDWNLVLYNAMAASSTWAALYFFALVLIGKHVLLNVLVGIVVQSFQARQTTEDDDQDSFTYSIESDDSTTASSLSVADTNSKEEISLNRIQRVLRWCKERKEWSFFMFSPENKFRRCCHCLISHRMFDHAVLFFILVSCVSIATERPSIDPHSTERWMLTMSSYVFSAVFFVEMLFKVLALGVVYGKDCYCSSSWNLVDGLLVILSLVNILVSLASSEENHMLGMLKVLRLLRTLRPLRVIKRAPKLKLAVEALLASVKPIGNIVIISCIFFFLYAILGVQLFKGKFFYCIGDDVRNISTRADCLSANYQWKRKQYNFDNLPQALMSLFVMYSKDGWVNLMYDGLDAVEVDIQPVRNNNEWILIFFISFMVISFFLLDMFIGVMVETFHQCQQEQKRADEVAGVLPVEGEVLEGQCSVAKPEQMPYYTYYPPWRQSIHTLCTSKFLDLFMTAVIVTSVLMMAFEHYQQPQYIAKLTEYSYYVFTAILILEVLLKFVAFGMLRFLKISWNLLDVLVVLVSIFSIILNEMEMGHTIPINPSILRVCRVLRLAQVLKAKKIRVLLTTIIKTLSQVGNICLLFTFFFFIYAALGVELFGGLECTEDYPCRALQRHVSFKHFFIALLTLYQVCTGDNWSEIMKDTLRECRPNDHACTEYLSWASPIYFTSFVVMAQFVLVNLVVAAIMQALEDSNEIKPNTTCPPLKKKEEQLAERAP